MNFTTRPPSACTTSLTAPLNSLSSVDNSVGVSTLGQRGEAGQVGETDAAHHARRWIADDALEIRSGADRGGGGARRRSAPPMRGMNSATAR